MAKIKESVSLPSELTAEILIRGALSLEQGESEKALQLLKKGLEIMIARREVSNRVAKEFKRLKEQEKEKKMSEDIVEICSATGNKVTAKFQCDYIEDWNEAVEQARREGKRICALSNGSGCVYTCFISEDSPEQLPIENPTIRCRICGKELDINKLEGTTTKLLLGHIICSGCNSWNDIPKESCWEEAEKAHFNVAMFY
jgi:hypothetical protein